MKTWVVTYIGLPDRQYREFTVWAFDRIEARSLADGKCLRIYGFDDYDCLEVKEPDFNLN
jgi:hypothetical protein